MTENGAGELFVTDTDVLAELERMNATLARIEKLLEAQATQRFLPLEELKKMKWTGTV